MASLGSCLYAQEKVTLKAGTMIPMVATSMVKAAEVNEGSTVIFRVNKDIIVDGKTVIENGTLVKGNVIEAAKVHDGAIPVLPMKDTVYFSEDGRKITSLLERKSVVAGQAPEAFKLEAYYEANRKLLPDKILEINGSTEPAILAGLDIAMIHGDESNFKITTREDFLRFEEMISGRTSVSHDRG